MGLEQNLGFQMLWEVIQYLSLSTHVQIDTKTKWQINEIVLPKCNDSSNVTFLLLHR